MPTKGIYTALSGAMAHGQRLDTIANNLANSSTPSFKRDQDVFREFLTANEKQPDVIQVPKVPASIESFYDMQGGDKGYVENIGTFTDFKQGSLRQTNNPLDLAINGKGFFEVFTPSGVQLTRNGSFRLDGEGKLVNSAGFPVLQTAEPGTDPAERVIYIDDPSASIDAKGRVWSKGEQVAQFSMLDVGNKEALRKVGNSLYSLKENQDAQLTIDEDSEIKQGFVENSNVNVVREMTDMIQASRIFESTQKAIKAYDQINGKLVNDVPKLG